MNARLIKNNRILIVDEVLEFSFINSINSTENIVLNNNCFITFSSQNEKIEFGITNNNSFSSSFVFNINYDVLLEFQSTSILFLKDETVYSLNTDTSIFEIDNEGFITVRIASGISAMTLNYLKNINIATQAYETGATFIDEKSFMPEFSISSFDDSNFTIPRPIRQGVPIISTVPSFVNNSSSSADIDFYESGKGPNFKTIYFRIICNKIMESISPLDQSSMKLKIYMPNGLDTVKKATYVPMYLVQNDSTNNISIYRASYDFYVQGIFEGIEFVDGYMYCDVQVPLTIQSNMPFEFDFSLL